MVVDAGIIPHKLWCYHNGLLYSLTVLTIRFTLMVSGAEYEVGHFCQIAGISQLICLYLLR
jgi:hypothetical protein